MDLPLVARLIASPPLDVLSQIRINFSMVLNLLLSFTPAQIEGLLERSFATFVRERRQQTLVYHFNRYLTFLQETEYVTPDGKLTEIGRWTSRLRVDQPLIIAEALRRGVLPSDPARLAALMASFVYEREPGDWRGEDQVSRVLEREVVQARRALQPFVARLAHRGFETRPLYLLPAWTMYAWATGEPWTRVVRTSGLAAGDVAMLASRTADHLRHLRSLDEVFPSVAAAAGRAIHLLLREPVVPETE
jgi:superfamily II RNA helicase